ncbi:MAG: hypothetical protein UT30_C0006G0044 [Candidatus Uhrbacteria bacterium GW2011_GWF2_39_13]|uniref:DUF7847 domain-containing protein n=1 Tax=Candidatus Uhrbacteria bacterium GW2011_GWF2_39_13 TaxID=1618995 RepID=A0A0G0Q294_9BACT|nr:MAG: hypothetical protein UT30_C0006G0044 [Candidatus Uhrbacteria bacterium GW2011_GWF2_39_13]
MLSTPRDLLIASFRFYRSHLWIFVGYTAWMLLPMMGFILMEYILGETPLFWLVILMTAIQAVLSLWITICLIHCVIQIKKNQPFNPNQLSLEALRRIQPLLIVSILQFLIVVGGMLLLIIPGILFWIRYAFAQQAVIIDKKNPKEALALSKSLVEGRFWKVLGRLVLGPLVIGLTYAVVLGTIVFILGSLLGIDTETLFSDDPVIWVQIIENIGDIFIIPLLIIYSVFLYEELKISPSGKDSSKTLPKLEKEPTVA